MSILEPAMLTPVPTESPERATQAESAKRRQILEGARQVFKSVGFDAASMNDITRAAGVSKGTIYAYFRSKEELFTALIAEVRERYREEFRVKLTEATDVESGLTQFGCALADMVNQDWALRAYRVVVGVAERMPELGQRFYEDGPARGVQLLSTYFDARVKDGTLSIPDTTLAAWQFIELVHASLVKPRLFFAVTEPPSQQAIEKVVKSAVAMFLSAYSREGLRHRPPRG